MDLRTSLFENKPTALECAVSQSANDLKITGFGQRTRAALRRNRSAESQSVLPYSAYKDVIGPDLVRHLNALTVLLNAEQPFATSPPSGVDQQLIVALRDQLAVVRQMVANMWPAPLHPHAGVFLDYDNVPIPFCPMYPDARDLINSNPAALPQPLTKVVENLRDAVANTPIMRESLECASDLTSTDIQHLQATRENFRSQVVYQRGETLQEWWMRAYRLVATAQSGVPMPLLLANALIHSVVSAVVSLAVWDHKLGSSEVISATPWGRHASEEEPDSNDSGEDADDTLPYGPDIPDGFSICLGNDVEPELILLPMETAVRLLDARAFSGVAISKGAGLSASRDDVSQPLVTTIDMTVVRLSSYEVSVADRGLP